MLTILSIVTGLVFVILLMSILASTVHDVIAAMLNLKGKNLRTTLGNMLGDHADDFFRHPFFQQLSFAEHHQRAGQPYALPDRISKETFSAVLSDLLKQKDLPGGAENLASKIAHLDDPKVRKLLEYIARQSDGTERGFRDKAEDWYDEMMSRSSNWYGRATKWRLLGIGLVLAFALNADTISIYKHLSANAALRDQLVGAAENLAKRDSLPVVKGNTIEETLKNIETFYSGDIKPISSPLGLGWNNDQAERSLPNWLVKVFGMLLMGIAVTFGAAFWFDALKKILAVRSNLAGKTGESVPKTGETNTENANAGRKKNAHPDDDKLLGKSEQKAKKPKTPPPGDDADDDAEAGFVQKTPAPPDPAKKSDRTNRRTAQG